MYAAVAWRPKKTASAQAVGDEVIRRGLPRRPPRSPWPGRRRPGAGVPPRARAARRPRRAPPHRQPRPPTAAQRFGHGDGERRGERGAQGQRHGVEPGHRADPVGEPALDDDRHQDVADRDAGQGQRAGGEEAAGAAGVRAYHDTHGDRRHTGADDRTRPPAPGQPGRGEAEGGEAQRGYGGQQPGDGAAHPEAVADLLQEGAEAGDGRAEVERGEDETGDHDPRQPAAGRPGRREGLRGGFRGARLRWSGTVGGPGGGGRTGLGGGAEGREVVVCHRRHHRIMG